MPIFTEADKPLYFPNITLTGAAFDTFILQVQSIIESPLGTNRPLEKQRHKEKLRLNTTLQTAYLTYKPIDLTETPIIKARIGNAVASVSGYVIPQHEWTTLDGNQYQIDDIDGKISLNTSRGGTLAYAYGGANLGCSSLFTEILCEYTAGYDFSKCHDAIAQQIKLQAANIAKYLYGDRGNSAFAGKQIKTEQIEEEYKVEYFPSNNRSERSGLYGTGTGQIPRSLMQYFIDMQSVGYGL